MSAHMCSALNPATNHDSVSIDAYACLSYGNVDTRIRIIPAKPRKAIGKA